MEKTIVLWVNQWFSTMYQIILQMKEGAQQEGRKLYVIGSSSNEEAVYRVVCDAFYKEPEFQDQEAYVKWCLAFCKSHQVNAFMPKKHFLEIAEHRSEFTAAGVQVMVEEDATLLRRFNNKIETAAYFGHYLKEVCEIPEYEVVTTARQFQDAYSRLKAAHPETKLCMKYVEGEGGASFKIIDEMPLGIWRLESGSMHLTYEEVVQLLATEKTFKPLMVMPYLKGMEVSVDCVPMASGLVAVPRLKGNGRIRIIEDAPIWQEKANQFWACAKLKCPFNLQFRYHEEKLYLLEVNTRLSGGVHYAYYGGINLPYMALCQLMGFPVHLPKELKKIKFSYVEQPVILPM